MVKRNFYFVGFGNMAQAIYQQMDKKAYRSIGIIEVAEKLKELGSRTLEREDHRDNFYLTAETVICDDVWFKDKLKNFKNSDIFLLAVKPADIKRACENLSANFLCDDTQYQPIIISIVAGVKIDNIAKYLGRNYDQGKIVRAMPNLCAKKGVAMTGLYGYFSSFPETEQKRITKIFDSIGQVLWVSKESDLDSVTAISGSGPAYIYYIMNAMIDAAQELGLEKSVAQILVAQTIIGAGETGKDINDLGSEIIKVSSKGGTTEKAIDVFKQKKIDTIIKQAVKAAHKRSKELSK
jgi:pyrroline-5-carboxylate reductase